MGIFHESSAELNTAVSSLGKPSLGRVPKNACVRLSSQLCMSGYVFLESGLTKLSVGIILQVTGRKKTLHCIGLASLSPSLILHVALRETNAQLDRSYCRRDLCGSLLSIGLYSFHFPQNSDFLTTQHCG